MKSSGFNLGRWWRGLGPASRTGVVGGAAVAFVMLVLVVSQPAGGFEIGGVSVVHREPDAPTATPTDTATPTATPEPEEEVIESLQELREQYGQAPDATFARFRIPKIGVDAPVSARYVEGSSMPLPSGPGAIAWYDLSAWAGLGGEPGQGANAVFGGHVDYNDVVYYADNVHYRGPGVLNSLRLLTPGDLIEIDYGGTTYTYSVTWTREMSPDTDWEAVWSADVPVDSITVYTCGGEFDFESHTYASRTVVRAERLTS